MFKMAKSDGEFAYLNTSSSHQGSCQNTPGGGGGGDSVAKNMGALAR